MNEIKKSQYFSAFSWPKVRRGFILNSYGMLPIVPPQCFIRSLKSTVLKLPQLHDFVLEFCAEWSGMNYTKVVAVSVLNCLFTPGDTYSC